MLSTVDALIENGQFETALKQLSKIEKHSYDSWSKIGVYRRYYNLGQTKKCETLLKKAVKKNPNNLELSALYTHLLLQQGKLKDALKVAEVLKGTRFGSFYSEVYFALFPSEEFSPTEKYFNLYKDAYSGTQNTYWLNNCALIYLKDGNYNEAAKLSPQNVYLPEDAYFWSLVMFDAKLYGSASSYAEKANTLYENSSVKSRHNVSKIEIASILSDSYLALSDIEEAERVRSSLLSHLNESTAGMNIEDENVKLLLPAIYVDSALYAISNDNYETTYRLLSKTLDSFPDYVPSLVLYGTLSQKSSLFPEYDTAEQVLKDNNLATLKMEKFDSIPKVSPSDALYKMNQSFEKTKDAKLYIALLNLKYQTDKSITRLEKLADVWNELEKTQLQTNVYNPLVLEYALHTFITYERTEDAFRLLFKHISAKYNFDATIDFWEQVVRNVHSFTIREAEYAAWFAAFYKKADTALRLYEYCVFESAHSTKDFQSLSNEKTISLYVTNPSCINLAMIYYSLSRPEDALDLFSKTANRTVDSFQKAECLFRMAEIYQAQNKIIDAEKAASYALTLYPMHAKAKLLNDTLRDSKK
ncbi:MAG: hypothetical protein IKI31_07635 [Treponema sp.]|nr:hypothetical protein [Treponema sp.]